MIEERIQSRKNPLLAHIRKLCSSRKYRREQGQYVGDGLKLLEEALRWEVALSVVVIADGVAIPALPQGVRLVRVPEDVMAYISPMETPQGALFVGEIPFCHNKLQKNLSYLVLDGVQDPGNVGTILRSADAMGADALVLVNGCADPWGWKTVRASMGASFRLPVLEMTAEELIQSVGEQGIPLYATALRDDTVDVRECPLKGTAVVIGSEGRGVSDGLLNCCDATVKIPMRERCESLNAAVAATIVLWEMGK